MCLARSPINFSVELALEWLASSAVPPSVSTHIITIKAIIGGTVAKLIKTSVVSTNLLWSE